MRRGKRWVLALVLSLVVAVIGAVAVGCGKAKKYTFNYNSMGGGAVAAAEYTVGDTKFYFPTPAQVLIQVPRLVLRRGLLGR